MVRPGFVVGPHDHTGRFTWWVHRAARGGVLPVPESIARRIQVIDARDLGAFVVRAATEPLHGVFNATGPVPPISMVDVVEAAAAAAQVELSVAVVPDAAATALGLGFSDLPLWLDDPEWAAWAEVDVSRAVGAGLSFRPLADTVAATLPGGGRRRRMGSQRGTRAGAARGRGRPLGGLGETIGETRRG